MCVIQASLGGLKLAAEIPQSFIEAQKRQVQDTGPYSWRCFICSDVSTVCVDALGAYSSPRREIFMIVDALVRSPHILCCCVQAFSSRVFLLNE